MSQQNKQMEAVYELLMSSQKSLDNAMKLLEDIVGKSSISDVKNKTLKISAKGLASYSDKDNKIVEGVFTGESMLSADGNIYPVPHNYACKSHIVQWSKLKATIDPSGKMLYKIIVEIPYEHKKGVVVESNGRYQVIADGKSYHVLPSAITFLKAWVGDMVSIRIPAGKDATYGAPDVLIPKEAHS